MPIDDIINQTTDIEQLRAQERAMTNGAAKHPQGGQQQRTMADGGQQQPPQTAMAMTMPQTPMQWVIALQAANVLLLAVLVFVK